jgi:glycosyltransferase involved in cell wall biosynthesis
MQPPRPALVYILHSSNLYGTERMALATAVGLADQFQPIFIGPSGPALIEAEKLGFSCRQFRTSRQLSTALRPILREHSHLACVATGPRYSLVAMALNLIYQRKIRQIQIIHGGAGDEKDYGRKKFLNRFPITFIAVSPFVKQRLIDHGVRAEKIEVVPNFLPAEQIAAVPRHPPFTTGVRNAIAVSRLVKLKRLDLLLDALQQNPSLADFVVEIVGDGPDKAELMAHAAAGKCAAFFAGFQSDMPRRSANADLLVHTCPTEPFGLVILEAFAANIPVLVPDQGGAADLIEEGVTGFKFRADDSKDLAKRLIELRNADPELINRVVANAAESLRTRFSAETALARYRQLFAPVAT